MIAAITAFLVADGSIERPEAQVEYLSVAGEDVSATVAAIEQIGEKVFTPFAPFDADPGVELTAYEVPAVKRDE
jgi:hypothetical protein